MGISVQRPEEEWLSCLDMPSPPPVGGFGSNYWILAACHRLIERKNPDFVYCTTNDYMMHRYPPESQEAEEHMALIDRWIGKLYELCKDWEIYITADHGMNQKYRIVDMQEVMDRKGFDTVCVPALKDRYVENHIYQEGGVIYLYLNEQDEAERKKAIKFLRNRDYIDEVISRSEAEAVYSLPPDGIGDYVLFAAQDCAFGELKGKMEIYPDGVRTHGSLHERDVPLVAVNASAPEGNYRFTKDIAGVLMAQE